MRAVQLAAALVSNRRIGIAVGLVMAQLNLDAADAFETLRRASMNTNRRLAELAEDVIYLRRLTPTPESVAVHRRGPTRRATGQSATAG